MLSFEPYSTQSPTLDHLLSYSARSEQVNLVGEGSQLKNNRGGRGLKRGHLLEISGPPGSGKTTLALGVVVSALKNEDEVHIVGMSHLLLGMETPIQTQTNEQLN